MRVTNTGERAGASIVQLYVGCDDSNVLRARNELKGFGRAELDAGETALLEMDVADDNLRYFDETLGDWRLEPCVYRLSVGFSSRDLPLTMRWQYADGEWTT